MPIEPSFPKPFSGIDYLVSAERETANQDWFRFVSKIRNRGEPIPAEVISRIFHYSFGDTNPARNVVNIKAFRQTSKTHAHDYGLHSLQQNEFMRTNIEHRKEAAETEKGQNAKKALRLYNLSPSSEFGRSLTRKNIKLRSKKGRSFLKTLQANPLAPGELGTDEFRLQTNLIRAVKMSKKSEKSKKLIQRHGISEDEINHPETGCGGNNDQYAPLKKSFILGVIDDIRSGDLQPGHSGNTPTSGSDFEYS